MALPNIWGEKQHYAGETAPRTHESLTTQMKDKEQQEVFEWTKKEYEELNVAIKTERNQRFNRAKEFLHTVIYNSVEEYGESKKYHVSQENTDFWNSNFYGGTDNSDKSDDYITLNTGFRLTGISAKAKKFANIVATKIWKEMPDRNDVTPWEMFSIVIQRLEQTWYSLTWSIQSNQDLVYHIMLFQKTNGIQADGRLGPETRERLAQDDETISVHEEVIVNNQPEVAPEEEKQTEKLSDKSIVVLPGQTSPFSKVERTKNADGSRTCTIWWNRVFNILPSQLHKDSPYALQNLGNDAYLAFDPMAQEFIYVQMEQPNYTSIAILANYINGEKEDQKTFYINTDSPQKSKAMNHDVYKVVKNMVQFEEKTIPHNQTIKLSPSLDTDEFNQAMEEVPFDGINIDPITREITGFTVNRVNHNQISALRWLIDWMSPSTLQPAQKAFLLTYTGQWDKANNEIISWITVKNQKVTRLRMTDIPDINTFAWINNDLEELNAFWWSVKKDGELVNLVETFPKLEKLRINKPSETIVRTDNNGRQSIYAAKGWAGSLGKSKFARKWNMKLAESTIHWVPTHLLLKYKNGSIYMSEEDRQKYRIGE